MKNFVDTNEDCESVIHTEMTMLPDQFEEFQVQDEVDPKGVTFCLKELRSIIGFADALGLPISANFEEGGK